MRSKTTQASAVGLPPFRRVAFEPRLARVREPRRLILRGVQPLTESAVSGTIPSRGSLEALHGTVVTRARAIGLAVPASEATYAILRPWADRNRPTAGH